MTQVPTVRGPVDSAGTRPHLHARAHLRADGRCAAELSGRMGGRGHPGGRRGPEAHRAGRAGGQHHRRPHRHRPRPLHPEDPAHRRPGAGPQHRGGHRLLHLQRRPLLLPLPGPGAGPTHRPDGRHVRGGHHRRDRRHRGEGGHAQVRHRHAGHDRRGGTDHAGGGQGPPGHRHPDHHPHPPRHPAGPGRPEGARRRGGRSPPGGPRPQRRLLRRRSPAGTGRGRVHPGDGPLRHQRRDHLRVAGRHRGRAVPARLRREHGAGPRCRLLHRLDRAVGQGGHPPVALPAHPRRCAALPARQGGDRRSRSRRCSPATPVGSSRTWRPTDGGLRLRRHRRHP